MGDIIENEDIDQDTVKPEVLDKLFSHKYRLLTETAVLQNNSYINKLSGTKSLKLATGQSDNSIEVFEVNKECLSRLCRLSGHVKGLTEVVFSPTDDHMLYSTGQDGLIKLWDLRAKGSCALEYKDEDSDITKQYECMDVSCNGRVLCAGSQLVQEDAYLVFWDQRMTKPLGGYWNSHTDDITQVKFHKQQTEILASGSVDGLLNIYNILEATEDDALTYTLNVEDSVERVAWAACEGAEGVWALTAGGGARGWAPGAGEGGAPRVAAERACVAAAMKRSRADDCYLVDILQADNTAVLLAGSAQGGVLRSLALSAGRLRPRGACAGNAQLVRCCYHLPQRDILVTGGEGGLLQVWGETG